jgi:hypothetical protein
MSEVPPVSDLYHHASGAVGADELSHADITQEFQVAARVVYRGVDWHIHELALIAGARRHTSFWAAKEAQEGSRTGRARGVGADGVRGVGGQVARGSCLMEMDAFSPWGTRRLGRECFPHCP